jgi:hypothetical protein
MTVSLAVFTVQASECRSKVGSTKLQVGAGLLSNYRVPRGTSWDVERGMAVS